MLNALSKKYRRLVLAATQGIRDMFSPRYGDQVIVPMREDSVRHYVSEGLTPVKLAALMHSFDEGRLDLGVQLCEQFEEKDAHIYSVANTRRLAFTGLPWEIISAADVDQIEDRAAADEARDYVREKLSAIESFADVLKHLSLALGRNIAVAEIVWENSEVVHLEPVPATRLLYWVSADYMPGKEIVPELRIKTFEERARGIPLVPNKWVVHKPMAIAGAPMRGGLLRLTAACYVAKAFSLKDWLIFLEVFGMPVRVGKYDPSATPADKEELLRMLQCLGTDAAGIFSKAVELELTEVSNRGEAPYQALCSFLNAELSKAWLGQTLTTEQGDRGSQALGRVQNEVRQDIRDDDIVAEGATIRRDLLRPMCEGQFGADVPVPYFRRRVDEKVDPVPFTQMVNAAVNQLGIRVSKSWVVSKLGIVEAAESDEEDVIAAQPVPAMSDAANQPGGAAATDGDGTDAETVQEDGTEAKDLNG